MRILEKIDVFLQPKEKDNVVWYAAKALRIRYGQDNLAQLGGQLAYFFVLSIFPFLMLVNQIISLYNYNIKEVLADFSGIVPPNMLSILSNYLDQLSLSQSASLFTFGAVSTIFLASKAITSLIYALHRAFRINTPIHITKSFVSVLFTAILLILIVLSLVFATVSDDIFHSITHFFGLGERWTILWNLVRWSIPFIGITVATMALYSVIPRRGFPKKYIFIGAIFSVTSWILMSFGLSYYTSNFGRYSLIYGSLGAIMIMLLYLYWSGIIIVLGGELAHILASRKIGDFQYDVRDYTAPK